MGTYMTFPDDRRRGGKDQQRSPYPALHEGEPGLLQGLPGVWDPQCPPPSVEHCSGSGGSQEKKEAAEHETAPPRGRTCRGGTDCCGRRNPGGAPSP